MIWLARLFIMPHVCIGIGIMGLLGLTLLTIAFGSDVAATVTQAHSSRSRKNGTTYRLNYLYTFNGRQFEESENVNAATFAAADRPLQPEGPTAKVQVRHLPLGPWHFQVLMQEDRTPWSKLGHLLFFGLFWNGILSVFVYVLWVVPIRARLLVRNGELTAGIVTGHRMATGRRSTSYYGTFRFRHPDTGESLEREMSLPDSDQYHGAQKGRAVTVIYDPRKPRRAIAYELSGFRVSEPR